MQHDEAHDVVELAETNDRIILTRDRKLIGFKKTRPVIGMVSSDPFTQLKQVIELLASRCVEPASCVAASSATAPS